MADKGLASKRVLMVIAPQEFRDEELLVPKKAFEDKGYAVTVASPEAGEAQGMLGAKVKPDLLLNQANAADYAAIVIVGGMGSPQYLWNNHDLHALLQKMNGEKKVVAAICLSGAVLANAQVLKNKKATVWATAESEAALAKGEAQYVKEHVVQDGNVVTADGPEAAAQFATSILNLLASVSTRA